MQGKLESRYNKSQPINFFIQKQYQSCSIKKGVLRNFPKFTGKHLCQSLFFNKVAGLRPSTLLKKSLAQVFSCELCEFSKNTFFYRTHLVAASGISLIDRLQRIWSHLRQKSLMENFTFRALLEKGKEIDHFISYA